MRLIFVRHGYPDYKTDSLTPLGQQQAARAAVRLAGEPISEIYSSPFGRAWQTAQPTAERFGLPVQIVDFMHEIDWHPLTGTEEEKQSWEIYHPWVMSHKLAKEGVNLRTVDYETLECWSNSTLKNCYAHVCTESDKWLEELGYARRGEGYECLRENNDTIALFAHHGSGTCLFSHLLNIPVLYLFAAFQYNFTGITVFDFNGKPGDFLIPEMEVFNDHSHIEDCEMPLMQ